MMLKQEFSSANKSCPCVRATVTMVTQVPSPGAGLVRGLFLVTSSIKHLLVVMLWLKCAWLLAEFHFIPLTLCFLLPERIKKGTLKLQKSVEKISVQTRKPEMGRWLNVFCVWYVIGLVQHGRNCCSGSGEDVIVFVVWQNGFLSLNIRKGLCKQSPNNWPEVRYYITNDVFTLLLH